MADHKGVFIYGEVSEGKLAPVTLELLGIGRRLADARGEECAAVLIDRKADDCCTGSDRLRRRPGLRRSGRTHRVL